jgi:hypothetical protein
MEQNQNASSVQSLVLNASTENQELSWMPVTSLFWSASTGLKAFFR